MQKAMKNSLPLLLVKILYKEIKANNIIIIYADLESLRKITFINASAESK